MLQNHNLASSDQQGERQCQSGGLGTWRKVRVSKLAYVAWTPKGCHWMPTTIAKPLSSISRARLDVETLKTLITFCAGGLALSLIYASRGLDLSAGFVAIASQ